MDGKSLAILKLYEQRDSLSCYDIGIIYNTDSFSIASNVNELRNLGYIDINEMDKSELINNILNIDTHLHITQSGKSYLFEQNENKRRFILQSIAVPFIVSVVSSIITAFLTVLLTK